MVQWVSLLRELDARPNTHTLPATAICPLCRDGRMRLIQDPSQFGIWAECRSCGFQGDAISLASECLKLDAKDTVGWIQDKSLLPAGLNPKQLLIAREKTLAEQIRAKQLIEAGTRGGKLVTDAHSSKILTAFNVPSSQNFSSSWIKAGQGQLAAVCHQDEIEDCFRPRKDNGRRIRRKAVIAPDVGHSIVVPYYDVPGRVCSIDMIYPGINRKWEYERHFLNLIGKRKNGGLAYHPSILRTAPEKELLVCDDPEFYFRMQMKHLFKEQKPLPLACYQTGPDVHCDPWQQFHLRDLVFWSARLTPTVLWKAIRLNAKITRHVPRLGSLWNFARGKDASSLVRNAIKKAHRWDETVAALVSRKDVEELADWVGQMDLTPDEQHMILQAAHPQEQDKLKRAMGMTVAYSALPIRGGCVEQRSSGWYFLNRQGEEEQIINMPFKINRAIEDSDQSLYEVEGTLRGNSFVSLVDRKAFTAKPFDCISEEAIKAGVGVPAFDPSWQRDAMRIAISMHPPVVTCSTNRVGLDPDRNKINLPRLSINLSSGEVSHPASLNDKLPGYLITSAVIDPSQLNALCSDSNAKGVLAATIAVTAQMLGDLIGLSPLLVGTRGRSAADAMLLVGNAIGAQKLGSSNLQSICTQAEQHQWPSLAGYAVKLSDKQTAAMLDARVRQLLVSPVSRSQMLIGGMRGDLVTVQAVGRSTVPSNQVSCLPPLILQTIKHCYDHKLQSWLTGDRGLLLGTRDLMRRTLEAHGVQEHSILGQASRLLYYHRDAAEAMAAAAANLVRTGDLLGPRDADDQDGIIEVGRNQIGIPQKQFLAAAEKLKCQQLDRVELDLRLTQSTKHKCEMRMIDKQTYWLIPKALYRKYSLVESRSLPQIQAG